MAGRYPDLQTSQFPPDVVLEGTRVKLVPLKKSHGDDLWEIAADERLWKWNPWPVESRNEMDDYIDRALQELAEGRSRPYLTTLSSGQVVGSTRFMNIVPRHRRLEIGSTWLGKKWQRTGINREVKLLMLTAAFEEWGYDRVELKTDSLNDQSTTAISKLGAKEEGTLRQHVVTRSGRVRDTVYYSIVREEWPAVRERLLG